MEQGSREGDAYGGERPQRTAGHDQEPAPPDDKRQQPTQHSSALSWMSLRSGSIARQRAARVLYHVTLEHALHHVRVLSGDVLVHLGVVLEVEELRLCAVVAGEHGVALVPGPDV